MKMSYLNRIIAAAAVVICANSPVQSRTVTLEEATEMALQRTGRGRIIDGHLAVARQEYVAKRTTFYVPSISINGALPAYQMDESYDFYQGTGIKGFKRSTVLDFNADITLQQSLITGGDFTLRANLTDNDWDYPVGEYLVSGSDTVFATRDVKETRQVGTFDFTFQQPIFKPSDPLYELRNKRDNLSLAEIERHTSSVELEKEVIEAYFGVLQAGVDLEVAADNLASARLAAEIDSIKLLDGVIDEETWLETASTRLDAELMKIENDNVAGTAHRDLHALLDWDSDESLDVMAPQRIPAPEEDAFGRMIAAWTQSLPIKQAELNYDMAKRSADYEAASHGLSGTIEASYGLERGDVEDNRLGIARTEDLQTDSWGLSLNFSYPLADFGAASALVQAARLEEEQARLELDEARSAAQAEILNLIDQVNLAYRKLEVMKRQVELAEQRVEIARERRDDGQISELTFLETRISFLESQDQYLEQIKVYYSTRLDLKAQFGDL